jgi:hypothetical protein
MTHIVTNKRDDEIAEFRRLAAKLGHPTMPDLHIGVKLVDKDGNAVTVPAFAWTGAEAEVLGFTSRTTLASGGGGATGLI